MTDKPEEPIRPAQPEDERPRNDDLLQAILKPKCDLCGSIMVEVHCRMMCPMCGYQRDCSDP